MVLFTFYNLKTRSQRFSEDGIRVQPMEERKAGRKLTDIQLPRQTKGSKNKEKALPDRGCGEGGRASKDPLHRVRGRQG